MRLALLVLILSFPSLASAQETPRVFGAGFGLGFGPATWSIYDDGMDLDNQYLISVGSLELTAFVDDHFSIDVSTQLWETLISPALGDFSATTTVYADWSLGTEENRFLVGPGLGIAGRTNDPMASRPDGGIEGRVALLLGYEYLTDDELFGFRVVTRPWLSLGGGTRGFEPGGGAMLEALFMFYAL